MPPDCERRRGAKEKGRSAWSVRWRGRDTRGRLSSFGCAAAGGRGGGYKGARGRRGTGKKVRAASSSQPGGTVAQKRHRVPLPVPAGRKATLCPYSSLLCRGPATPSLIILMPDFKLKRTRRADCSPCALYVCLSRSAYTESSYQSSLIPIRIKRTVQWSSLYRHRRQNQ